MRPALELRLCPPPGLALQPAAQRVFLQLGAQGARLVERHGANQSYDFFWAARCGAALGGAQCRVRGDSWEPRDPQGRIHIELDPHAGAAQALAALREALLTQGWQPDDQAA